MFRELNSNLDEGIKPMLGNLIDKVRTLPGNDNDSFLTELHSLDTADEYEMITVLEQIFNFLKAKRDALKNNLQSTKDKNLDIRKEQISRWIQLTSVYFVSEIVFAISKKFGIEASLGTLPSKCMEFVRYNTMDQLKAKHYLTLDELKASYLEIKRLSLEILFGKDGHPSAQILEEDFKKVEAKLEEGKSSV